MAEFTPALHETIVAYGLVASGSPLFGRVFKGDPNALTVTGGKPQARWQVVGSVDPPEGPRNIKGRRSAAVVFRVSCYWPLSGLEGAQYSQEDELAEVVIGLPAAIVALTPSSPATTYTIAGKTVGLVTIENLVMAQREFLHQSSESEYRVLSFEVHARILEAS